MDEDSKRRTKPNGTRDGGNGKIRRTYKEVIARNEEASSGWLRARREGREADKEGKAEDRRKSRKRRLQLDLEFILREISVSSLLS